MGPGAVCVSARRRSGLALLIESGLAAAFPIRLIVQAVHPRAGASSEPGCAVEITRLHKREVSAEADCPYVAMCCAETSG
jgi:hypothetical protein